MARNVNASFSGVVVSDVDPNALTRTRWLDESVADTALVHDLITGENTPPATLDHSGPGNGCVLGIPVANQLPGYAISGDQSTDTEACIWAIPRIQPPGESTLDVRVQLSDIESTSTWDMTFEVRNASWAVVSIAALEFGTIGNPNVAQSTVDGLTPGTQYFYRIIVSNVKWWGGGTGRGPSLDAVTVGWFRQAPASRALLRRLTSDVEDSTELSTKTASSATVIDFVDLDTAETQDGQAISGYHTTTLAQNQHALAEMLTGAPAGTNSSRTLTASASQGAFYDHGRLGSEWASMPLAADIPVMAYGLGVVPEDGGTGEDGSGGLTNGTNAPGWGTVTTSATYRELVDVGGWFPYADNDKLRVQILATSPANTLGALGDLIKAETFNGNTGASIDTDIGTFTQIGSTNWWWADLAAGIDHAGAASNRIVISAAITSGGPKADGSDLRIVGFSAFMED